MGIMPSGKYTTEAADFQQKSPELSAPSVLARPADS